VARALWEICRIVPVFVTCAIGVLVLFALAGLWDSLGPVGALLLSGVVMLAAGAVAVVYRRLDVDLVRPPMPLLDVPWTALAATVVVTVAVAGLAALYAQRAADRADPATVLREDA